MSWQLSPITEEPVSEAQDDPALVAAQNYEKNVVTYITIPITAILLEHASPQPGEHVVDMACGTGVVARQTAPRVGAAGTVVGGTPYETAAGFLEAQLKDQAIRKAGRPDMCLTATETSPTAYGVLSSLSMPGGFRPDRDVVAIFGIAELKTSFDQLHGTIHAAHCRTKLRGGQPSMVGGYGGGPEAAAILNIALTILQWAVLGVMYGGGNAVDVRYQGNCGRAGIWAQSIINQALSRNSNFLPEATAFQVAGPNTDMLLLESAVGNLVGAVSGASGAMLPYSSGGTKVDHITSLETKFCAEVMIAGAAMTRREVNEIAKALLPQFEEDLFHPPVGQSIRECYDLSTMEPKEDWLERYAQAKRELVSLGIQFAAEGGE